MWIVLQVTAISDSEEEAMGRADLVPFLLEDRIREVRLALPTPSHPFRDDHRMADTTPCAYWDESQAALRRAVDGRAPTFRTHPMLCQSPAQAFRIGCHEIFCSFWLPYRPQAWFETYLGCAD